MTDMITRHTGFLITPNGDARGRDHDFVLAPGATRNEVRDCARALEVVGCFLSKEQIDDASWMPKAP